MVPRQVERKKARDLKRSRDDAEVEATREGSPKFLKDFMVWQQDAAIVEQSN